MFRLQRIWSTIGGLTCSRHLPAWENREVVAILAEAFVAVTPSSVNDLAITSSGSERNQI